MIQELLYTSHEGEGLRKGSGGGFCTVLSTNAMAPNLAQALEKLSGYKHPFDAHDSRAPHNPVNYRFTTLRIGGKNYHVFSRVSDFRAEHTGRTNKLAHHLVADASLRPDCGPTAILASPLMRQDWNGKAGVVPPLNDNALSLGTPNEKPCQSWAKITGDAGWAGLVAEKLFAAPERPISVIFPVGSDPLALVSELFALIPATFRWEISFSTYFTTLPPGTSCRLRFLMDQTSEAEALRRDLRQETFDLMDRKRLLTESTFTEAARAGVPFRLETPGHARHQSSVMIGTRAKSVDELELEPLRVSDGDLVEIPSSFSRRSEVPVAVELPSGRKKSGPPELPSTSNAVRDFPKSRKDSKWRQGLLVGLAAGLLVGLAAGLLVGLFRGFGISQFALVGEPKLSEPSIAESNPDKVEPTEALPQGLTSEAESKKDGSTVGAAKAENFVGDTSQEQTTEKSDDETKKGENGQHQEQQQLASKDAPEEAEPDKNEVPSIIDIKLHLNGPSTNYQVKFSEQNVLELTERDREALKPDVLKIDYNFEDGFVVKGDETLRKKLQHCVYEITYGKGECQVTRYFYFPPMYNASSEPDAIANLVKSTEGLSGLKVRSITPSQSTSAVNLKFMLEGERPATEKIATEDLELRNDLTLNILSDTELLGKIELANPDKTNWRFLNERPHRVIGKNELFEVPFEETNPRLFFFPKDKIEKARRSDQLKKIRDQLSLPTDDPKRVLDANGLDSLFKSWVLIKEQFDDFEKALSLPVLEVYLPADHEKLLPERVVFQYSILMP